MGDYRYLPGIVVLIFGEFFIIVLVVWLCFNNVIQKRIQAASTLSNDEGKKSGSIFFTSNFESYFSAPQFELAYSSCYKGYGYSTLLLIIRILALLFFGGFDLIYSYSLQHGKFSS